MFYLALFCNKPIRLNKSVSNAFILKPLKKLVRILRLQLIIITSSELIVESLFLLILVEAQEDLVAFQLSQLWLLDALLP